MGHGKVLQHQSAVRLPQLRPSVFCLSSFNILTHLKTLFHSLWLRHDWGHALTFHACRMTLRDYFRNCCSVNIMFMENCLLKRARRGLFWGWWIRAGRRFEEENPQFTIWGYSSLPNPLPALALGYKTPSLIKVTQVFPRGT